MIFIILAIFVAIAIIGYVLSRRTHMAFFEIVCIISAVCVVYAFVAIFVILGYIKTEEAARWWLYFG